MLDTFESPLDGFGVAGAGDTRMGDAGKEGYAAAGPTESDDPEDEILEGDLDDEDDLDDDVDFDDEDDDGDEEDDIDDEEDDLDDEDDEDDLDDEYDTEDVERHHRGPGRGKYDDY